jgi:hypothetical protein
VEYVILKTIWSAPPAAALWLPAEQESQSGGVAAALQISMMGEHHLDSAAKGLEMAFPAGTGKSGEYLTTLWRRYLEDYAAANGSAEKQIVVGAYHAAEIFGSLSLTLDRDGRYRDLIEQRIESFREGARLAASFEDCVLNAAFALYNHLNTLSHEFTDGNTEAEELARQIDEQVKTTTQSGDAIERAAAAVRACFPLLSLVTVVSDQSFSMTAAIRMVQQRFASLDARAATSRERLLNGLYRLVEMMQIFTTVWDPELRDHVQPIAARFKEEDMDADLLSKLRNGFCRLFELGHLLSSQLDANP